jgi:hypothetical protein
MIVKCSKDRDSWGSKDIKGTCWAYCAWMHEQFLEIFNRNKDEFFRRYITMNVTWLLHNTPEFNRQSSEWTQRDEPIPKRGKTQLKYCIVTVKSRVLASSFWDWRPAFILQSLSHCDGHNCDHLWRFCDSLKAVTMKTDKESCKSPSLYLAFCDGLKAETKRILKYSQKVF